MEQEGLLQQRWIEADNGCPRKTYSITAKGKKSWEMARTDFAQSIAALKAFGAEATVKG